MSKPPIYRVVLDKLRQDSRSMLEEAYDKLLESKGKQHVRLPAKIIYFDDLHIPFVNLDLIEKMIETDGEADAFVWGEVLNLDAFAYYIKQYQSNPAKEDNIACQLVDLLLKHYKRGFTLETNHTKRIDKFLKDVTDPVQLAYFKRIFGGILPTFTKISHYVKYMNLPVLQLGKAVFAHFDSFSSIPGRTVEWIMQTLLNWHDCYGVSDDFDSVWIGHTHNQETHTMYKKMLYEIGSMCYVQDYVLRGRATAAHRRFRWMNGYGVVYLQKDGSTDFNKSRYKFLGFAKLPTTHRT